MYTAVEITYRTWINDNLCYLTINCDTGQHCQFLQCSCYSKLFTPHILKQGEIQEKVNLSNRLLIMDSVNQSVSQSAIGGIELSRQLKTDPGY